MKRTMTMACILLLTLCLSGCGKTAGIWFGVILLILGVALLALGVMRAQNIAAYRRRQARKGRRVPQGPDVFNLGIYGLAGVLVLVSLLLVFGGKAETPPELPPETTIEETTQPEELFKPEKTADSDPAAHGVRWEIFDGVTKVQSYQREEPISFGQPEGYFALPGVSTFRGNNYRNSATYGTANVVEKTLTTVWTQDTGTLEGSSWGGNGWTGQPLIVCWDDTTRQLMNLHPEKKAKTGLVEVIYASLDGRIYFLDLEDGSHTRDPINVGMCFKGAGTLDPRGYPILYVGAGDVNPQEERPRMFIISLIDGSILYEYGHEDSLSYREDNDNWCAFDSAPLIHADTDTLIWPGENGILYTMKLNTAYDPAVGSVRVSPSAPVLTRYLTNKTNTNSYWLGYEASANIVDHYLYISENGGLFFCIDLNTLELIWVQDTKDDSNASPVFQPAGETEGYLYTAPSLHWTKDSDDEGTISIYKLSATTGQILWQRPYDVHTVYGLSGGVQASPVLGKAGTDLDGLIFYAIARTTHSEAGSLVALDTATGQQVWRLDMDYYAWSSSVAVYDPQGKGYVVLCDSNGTAHFVEGATGQVADTLYLGGLVEASPAVYNDKIVVGTRLKKICGIEIR